MNGATKTREEIFEARAAEQRAADLASRTCECGGVSEGDSEPVTVGGWHGDICYGWGR